VTVVGKLDRAALPAPRTRTAGPASRAPRTATEERVAVIWRSLLERDDFGRDDNFFDAGGHSLLLIRVHTRLRPATPELSVLDLFRYPTLRTLGARIDALGAGGSRRTGDVA